MIQRRAARTFAVLAATMAASQARAGVWGMDPVLGLTGAYDTNPALLFNVPRTVETTGAVLLDAPTTYYADAWKFYVLPSFRVGDTKGYASVTSNYEHLNTKAEYDTERSTITATAGAARDSSLYYNYLSNGTSGVRRDSGTVDLNWDRLMTERVDFDTDVNATRVRYAQTAGVGGIVDYSYLSIAPTVSWTTSEQTKLTAAASVGRYRSLDGTTESRSANLQVGFIKQLAELWTLTATAGYSRSLNQVEFSQRFIVFTPMGPVIEVIPQTFKSSQNGSVYSVNLSHQGTLLVLNATASRQLTPTGFAFLSRQNALELRANYTLSTRWSIAANARYVKEQDPTLQGQFYNRNVQYYSLSGSWQWTELWTVTIAGSRIAETVESSLYHVRTTEASLTLTRKFKHIDLQ